MPMHRALAGWAALGVMAPGCNLPNGGAPESGRGQMAAHCGAERWDVKTGGDLDARSVDLEPKPSSVQELIQFPRPTALIHHHRIGTYERQVFKLTDVELVKYKQETDSDYHLVVSDGDWTLIAEIPFPDCVPFTSPFATAIRQARRQFESRFSPTDRFQRARVPITIVGVGFFDFLHDQTGVAPNGFELHPVLGLCLGFSCELAAMENERPPPSCGCAVFQFSSGYTWMAALAALRWLARRRPKPNLERPARHPGQ